MTLPSYRHRIHYHFKEKKILGITDGTITKMKPTSAAIANKNLALKDYDVLYFDNLSCVLINLSVAQL